mgnify:CR=1 FL=1
MEPTVTTVTARVMRSHDYCQFELALTAEDPDGITMDGADDLRRCAATLVDEAVRQYDEMRAHARRQDELPRQKWEMEERLRIAKSKKREDLTLAEADLLRQAEDASFWARFDAEEFDYLRGGRDPRPWREKLKVRVEEGPDAVPLRPADGDPGIDDAA